MCLVLFVKPSFSILWLKMINVINTLCEFLADERAKHFQKPDFKCFCRKLLHQLIGYWWFKQNSMPAIANIKLEKVLFWPYRYYLWSRVNFWEQYSENYYKQDFSVFNAFDVSHTVLFKTWNYTLRMPSILNHHKAMQWTQLGLQPGQVDVGYICTLYI